MLFGENLSFVFRFYPGMHGACSRCADTLCTHQLVHHKITFTRAVEVLSECLAIPVSPKHEETLLSIFEELLTLWDLFSEFQAGWLLWPLPLQLWLLHTAISLLSAVIVLEVGFTLWGGVWGREQCGWLCKVKFPHFGGDPGEFHAPCWRQ